MTELFIFKILPAIITLSFAVYLTFIKFNPRQREKVLNKHKKGTDFGLYEKIYSDKFLIAWLLLTLSYLLDMVLGGTTSQLIVNLVFVISMSLSLAAVYLLFTLFFRRKK